MARKGFVLLLLILMSASVLEAAQTPQIPLAGGAIPKFVQPLPLLSVAGGPMTTVLGNRPITIHMCEFNAQVLPAPFPPTRVWGYIAESPGTLWAGCPTATQGTYLGPVIVNARATPAAPSPTSLTFVNDLGTGASTQVLAWKYSTDQTLHWADPLGGELNLCNKDAMMGLVPAFGSPCAQNYSGPIPGVVHLHGGEVPPELDGGPDAWVTSDGLIKGHGYYSFPGAPANAATYKYPNTQEASPIWFHDHALGVTRLNVYAGLAGAYLITDPNLVLPTGLHPAGLSRGTSVDYTVPVVLQDRMFDTNGQLFFQADSAGGLLWATNPEHPYWSPEFVGDSIVVNGKAWPYLNVEPKRYRFWFINGSNARTYEMFLIDPLGVAVPPRMWVIATDGGYLDAPVQVKKLVMMPGERYEVIVDFAGVAPGTNLILKNTAKTPYPGGAAPQGATLGQIMQFRVGSCPSGQCGVADTSFNPAVAGATIRGGAGQAIVRLANPATGTVAPGVTVDKTRQLTLNEVMGMPVTFTDPVTGLLTAYPGGPLEILVNNTKWSGESITRTYGDFLSLTVGGVTTAYSEIPKEGETEVWEIVNLTADAHPIHLHLVQFQILNRQDFDVKGYAATYGLAFPSSVFQAGFGPPLNYYTGNTRALGGNPDIAVAGPKGKPLYLKGTPAPPLPQEAGWKDTVMMSPGQVTRIAVRWAPTDLPAITANTSSTASFPFDPSGGFDPATTPPTPGYGYVWHCHIIDHEDNEMMRPDLVQLNPAAPLPALRPLVKGIDY
jgi:FtsP/CotA-like multicopper oxidase with cupredoxin domain